MRERLFLVTYLTDKKPTESYDDMRETIERVLDFAADIVNKGKGHFEVLYDEDFDEIDLSRYKRGDLNA